MNWDEGDAGKAYAAQVASHRGWVVNPDQDLTAHVTQSLAQIARVKGKPYCPCRDAEGQEADHDIVCPCKYATQDIQEYGQCFCGLFLSPLKDPAEVTSIPERRPEPEDR